jgi:hypothetical protein
MNPCSATAFACGPSSSRGTLSRRYFRGAAPHAAGPPAEVNRASAGGRWSSWLGCGVDPLQPPGPGSGHQPGRRSARGPVAYVRRLESLGEGDCAQVPWIWRRMPGIARLGARDCRHTNVPPDSVVASAAVPIVVLQICASDGAVTCAVHIPSPCAIVARPCTRVPGRRSDPSVFTSRSCGYPIKKLQPSMLKGYHKFWKNITGFLLPASGEEWAPGISRRQRAVTPGVTGGSRPWPSSA